MIKLFLNFNLITYFFHRASLLKGKMCSLDQLVTKNEKKHTLTTLNNIATLKTTKYYDEPLDHYSPATALNLIEVVPESNKH